MLSFLRGVADKQAIGNVVQKTAWKEFCRAMRVKGIFVTSVSDAPTDGTECWVYFSESGHLWADADSKVNRIRMRGITAFVAPTDHLRRHLPFHACTLSFSISAMSYSGIAEPSNIETLLLGHPYENQIRRLRAGTSARVTTDFTGVDLSETLIYASGGNGSWRLFTSEVHATEEAKISGGTVSFCGRVEHPKWCAASHPEGFVTDNDQTPIFIQNLLGEDASPLCIARFVPAPSWASAFTGSTDELARRFPSSYCAWG
jgi:hypothetical protein